MTLRIRFQGGRQAGEVLEFGPEVQSLRFGRDGARCQVVFPPDASAVSREHFELQRRPGYWALVTNRQRPVFVEGMEGYDGQRLELPSELTVGRDGPKLLVEDDAEELLPSTAGERVERHGAHTRIERVTARATHNLRISALAVALAIISAVALWLGIDKLRGRTRQIEAAVVEGRERDDALRHEVERKWKALAKAKRTFRDISSEAERSVYNVQLQFSETRQFRFGTAWVVKPGILATNAHVAEKFEELSSEAAYVVRASSPPNEALPIESITMHPGYARWGERNERFLPPEDLIPACDVALLHVAPEYADRLGPPLPIASRQEIEALSSGTPLASLGFPGEGLAAGGSDLLRPKATLQVGIATAVTDFFFQNIADHDRAQLVHHDLPTAGGASGGPILNEEGKVVAVNSAGNFAFMYDWGYNEVRVPVGGINFAQRADLVLELFEGDVERIQAERDLLWDENFEQRWPREGDQRWARSVGLFRTWLINSGAEFEEITLLAEESLTLTAPDWEGAAQLQFQSPAPGSFAAVVQPLEPVDLDLALSQAGTLLRMDTGNAREARLFYTGVGKEKFSITVLLAEFSTEPVEAVLRVFYAHEAKR